MSRGLHALRVVHPFPSLLNAALVTALAYLAARTPVPALLLGAGMLGMQFSIGIVNDIVDRGADAHAKPWKPLVAGLLSLRAAAAIAVIAAGVGFVSAAAISPTSAALWLAMLACGLSYDIWLKPTPFAWSCFAIAFTLLPVYGWHGATGLPPPRAEFLLPLAFLTGPQLQLANGLVDLEADAATGVPTLAGRLGRLRCLLLLGTLFVLVHALAWATLAVDAAALNAALPLATAVGLAGLMLSARRSVRARAAGWTLQAAATALLAIGWLAAVTAGA